MSAASFVRAGPQVAGIGLLPTIRNASPELKSSLNAIRIRVQADARACLQTAKEMEAVGQYSAAFKNMLDTGRVLVLEVSGSMICDGIHSSSYRYGVAFEKDSGKRLDLNRIYNIGTRSGDRLFLRAELIDAAAASYRRVNMNERECLDRAGWELELINVPITFSPQSDGSIILYYAASDVSAACFHGVRLEQGAFAKFRSAEQATQYRLP